jgi:hypothetical protein
LGQGVPLRKLHPPRSAEKVAQGIQKHYFEIFNFHTLTCPLSQMKDKHLVHLPIMSDFLNVSTAKTQQRKNKEKRSHFIQPKIKSQKQD